MKKRILCIALAALFVVSAIFFAFYNRLGNTYNYENKDMSKYLGDAWTKEAIQALYANTFTLDTAEDIDVQYAIAKAIAAKNADSFKKDSGEFGLYDTLLANYYMTTEIDGKTVVISLADKMAPGSKTGMQLGADTDFAKMIKDLLGKKVSDNSYVTFTSGKVYAGDNLYIEYSVDGKKGSYEKVVMEGDAYLDYIYSGLTAAFKEKLDSDAGVTIGSALSLTLKSADDADVTASLTVKFVSRTIIKDAGKAVTGDRVFFDYYLNDAEKATSYVALLGETKDDKNVLDKDLGEGFTAELMKATIGGEKGEDKDGLYEFTLGEGESKKSYKVKINYVIPVDANDKAREGYQAAENFFVCDYTYDDESEAKSEVEVTNTVDGTQKTEKISLAGRAVKLHVAVTNFYDMSYDYTTIIDVLKYAPGKEDKVDLYLSAYAAFKTAEKAYNDGVAKTGDAALSEEEKKTLLDKKNEAETKMNEAKTAYEAELGEGKTTTPDDAAVAAYNEYTKDAVQTEMDNDYRYSVAQEIWDKLYAATEGMNLPSKAVKVAYKGLIDDLKATYYSKRTTEAPYSEHSTFKSYLKWAYQEEGGYKAALTAEAEKIVHANVLLYYLVDLYEITLDQNQQLMISIYMQLGQDLQAETFEYQYLFDNTMKKITEIINPTLVRETETESADDHAGHDHE